MKPTIKLYSYIFTSFLLAALLSAIQLPKFLQWIWPQWMVLILIFWVLNLPNRVNFGLAFSISLLLDTLSGSILGEHGLALVIPVYFIIKFNNKIIFNKINGQTLIIFLLVVIYQAILYLIHGVTRNTPVTPAYWLSSITSAFMWPSVAALLEKYARLYKINY